MHIQYLKRFLFLKKIKSQFENPWHLSESESEPDNEVVQPSEVGLIYLV